MPKVRLLVPLADPFVEGKMLAPGEIIDVNDEVLANWKADGKISVVADEEAAAKAATESGHYSDRTSREDVEPLDPSAEQDGPQADEPSSKKGKR